jgi:hypothetical protein
MDTYYDRTTHRTFVTEPAHPVVAWVIVALAVCSVALPIVIPPRDTPTALVVGGVCLAAFAAFLLWMAARAFTEVVATFDGKARSLTVTRTRPWQRTEQTFPYEDIIGVAARENLALNSIDHISWVFLVSFRKDYKLEIMLTGGRDIRLRADGETESDEAVKQIHQAMSNSSGS